MSTSFISEIPVRIGTSEEFACVAQALKEASFDENTICSAFKLKEMSDVGSITAEDVERCSGSRQFQLLVRLFLSPSLVPRTEVEQIFERTTIESFLSLGLLGIGEFGDDEFYARALLYPVAGFFIASDRHSAPDNSVFDPPPDVVFPAIYGGTLHFLRLLPESPRGEVLDLCAGTGIGALTLSRRNRKAVSADITERATQFALFNRALNNCYNVEVVRGDLYEAVPGRTFDCIVAHPPYVPSLGVERIWRDGGVTGELLVKRIIEALPEHLARGGIFCCQTQGMDTMEGRFEERVRSWLEDRADQFDIVFAVSEERTAEEVLDALASKQPGETTQALKREFDRAGLLRMPFGVVAIRREEESAGHKPLTTRRRMSEETLGADLEAAFVLHDRLSAPDLVSKLIRSAPRLAPRLQVKVTHVVHDGSLVPADFLFEVDKPFQTFLKFEPWMALLLARLDGRLTLREIYDQANAEAGIPEEFKPENFVVLVARAMEAGYVVLE
jgi:16S rRNA G966 N2-methylase RsmD